MPGAVPNADHDNGKRILGSLHHRFDGRSYVTRMAMVYVSNSVRLRQQANGFFFAKVASIFLRCGLTSLRDELFKCHPTFSCTALEGLLRPSVPHKKNIGLQKQIESRFLIS